MNSDNLELHYVYRDDKGNIIFYTSSPLPHLPKPEEVYLPKTDTLIPLSESKKHIQNPKTGQFEEVQLKKNEE